MSEVQKIEQAIEHLSNTQLAEFRRWYMNFDAAAWDTQIEADAASGKLETFANEAIAEYQAGKAREL